MATLEKIRSRSVLLFTIIILALLAFILGDFFNSSRSFFGPGHTAATVAGEKIDFNEFNRRVEQATQQMQQQGYAKVETEQIQAQVLQQMANEALFNKEIEKLGIVVTDNELSESMIGESANPQFVQYIYQQFGMHPRQLHELIFSNAANMDPAQTEQLKQMWIENEKMMTQALKQQKLINLFNGSLRANKIDAQEIHNDNSVSSTIRYAKVDLNSVPDSVAVPSEAEINAKYNETREQYKLTDQVRNINYIVVDIVPSAEDLAAAQAEIDAALALLNTSEGTDALSGMFVVNNTTAKKSELNGPVASAIDTMSVGTASYAGFSNNTHRIVKLLGVNHAQKDTVTFDMAQIEVTGPAQRDSIINALNNGAKLADFTDAANIAEGQKASMLDQQAGAQVRELFADAATGKYFTPDTLSTANAIRVFRANRFSAPVTTYDVAEIQYAVDPSSTTINKLNSDLRNYLAENNTAQKFSDNALAAGYRVFPAEVTKQALAIANIPSTRGAVKWVLNAKNGQVSDIYGDEQTGRLIAVALNNTYDGYTPVTDKMLNSYLTELVKADKKAAKLIEQYSGKASSVDGYAQIMGTSVDTTSIAFGQRMIQGFSFNESNLAANVASAPKGKLEGPIQTQGAVAVFEVTDVTDEGGEFDFNTEAARFNRQQGGEAMSRNIFLILLGNNKIDNKLLNFYQD
ncbi:MAG: SurA N-terminal domain-containing protein [Muribaculaceae bacterium]|nr:SurA N-terminal domain-containing protein [Muribaculaceae bacterium]